MGQGCSSGTTLKDTERALKEGMVRPSRDEVIDMYQNLLALEKNDSMLVLTGLPAWILDLKTISAEILNTAVRYVNSGIRTIAFWPGKNETPFSEKMPPRGSVLAQSPAFRCASVIKKDGDTVSMTYEHSSVATKGSVRDPKKKSKRISANYFSRAETEQLTRNVEVTLSGFPINGDETFPLWIIKGPTNPNEKNKFEPNQVSITERSEELSAIVERTYKIVGEMAKLVGIRLVSDNHFNTRKIPEFLANATISTTETVDVSDAIVTQGTLLLAKHKSVPVEIIADGSCEYSFEKPAEMDEYLHVAVLFENYDGKSVTSTIVAPLVCSLELPLLKSFAQFDQWQNQGKDGMLEDFERAFLPIGLVC